MDPIRNSLEHPLVLVVRATRAESWPQAKAILDTIPEAAPYEAALKAYYFVVKPERELFAKAMAIVDLLGHTKAIQIYVNGGLTRSKWELSRIGECFLKASKFPDSRKYCHVIHEFEDRSHHGMAVAITFRVVLDEEAEQPEDKSRMVRRALVPCRYLYERVRYRVADKDLDTDGFAVIAVDNGVDMCPLFNADAFAELFPKMIGKNGEVENG